MDTFEHYPETEEEHLLALKHMDMEDTCRKHVSFCNCDVARAWRKLYHGRMEALSDLDDRS